MIGLLIIIPKKQKSSWFKYKNVFQTSAVICSIDRQKFYSLQKFVTVKGIQEQNIRETYWFF